MGRSGFLTFEAIRHRGSLLGRTIDGRTQAPVAGVEVTLVDGPAAWLTRCAALHDARPLARPDRYFTDGNGQFRYLDLPPGTYRLAAALGGTRYAPGTATATVGTVTAIVDVALPPTALTGVVQAGSPPLPLAMVRVRVVDTGEVTYTAADGRYVLSPLEAGDRTLELSAARHATATLPVTLHAGQTTTTSPFTLTRS